MNALKGSPPDSQASGRCTGECLIVFTRYPTAGQTKTRLIPVLGWEGAARLQRRLTLRAIRAAEGLRRARGVDLEIRFEGAERRAMEHWLGERFDFHPQGPGDLGAKMLRAFEDSWNQHTSRTVLIGADCPGLTREILNEAFEKLREFPVVFGPAVDGGYYLVGLRQPIPQLFSGPAWGASTVLHDSLKILQEAGHNTAFLRPLADIDRPEDLAVWNEIIKSEAANLSKISVIIPALNEADKIASTIAAAFDGQSQVEVVVVDGGSQDETVEKAKEAGAAVLRSGRGRARQMNAGACIALGDVLLFVHADTLVPGGYVPLIAEALRSPAVAAGAFGFALDGMFPGRQLVEFTTNLRSRWRQMPYGDQGLFLRASLFEELGGFADLPVLEDYEFVRRLRQCGRVLTLERRAMTSGRRWQRLGFLCTTLLNQWMIAGYHLGWPIERLAGRYTDPAPAASREAQCRNR